MTDEFKTHIDTDEYLQTQLPIILQRLDEIKSASGHNQDEHNQLLAVSENLLKLEVELKSAVDDIYDNLEVREPPSKKPVKPSKEKSSGSTSHTFLKAALAVLILSIALSVYSFISIARLRMEYKQQAEEKMKEAIELERVIKLLKEEEKNARRSH